MLKQGGWQLRGLPHLAATLLFLLLPTSVSGQTTDTTVEEAQSIARLYSASLDRPPLTGGLNFFIDSFEAGRSIISIAEDFVLSDEFVAKYGELDDTAYVERLFLNVLGRPGAQGGIDFWVGNLTNGESRAFVLSKFADSPENIANTAILYDSMAFVDGQWRYSRVDEILQRVCGNSGCLQSELNGAVGGAAVSFTLLSSPDDTDTTISSLDESGLRSLLGGAAFNDMSDFDRLQLLGILAPPELQAGQLYLLTVSGGADFDNDINQIIDDNPTPLAGEYHVIATAEQIAAGLQINVMGEAGYQSVLSGLGSLSDDDVLQALDDAAFKLVKNVNLDGAVNHLDVLAWRRLLDNENIRTDLVDVNKLAVAISTGRDGESLQIFANRMLGGAAAVGLDETSSVAINPDGTCSGRGRTIINRNQESITTLPPTAVCGEDDTGRVESTQGEILGTTIPASSGLANNTEIRRNNDDGRRNNFEFSDVDPNTNEITIEHTDNNGTRRRGNVPVSSTDAAEAVSRRFRSLSDDSIGPGSVDGVTILAGPVKQRRFYGAQKIPKGDVGVGAATAEQDLFTSTLTESMSYGALASNFTACLVFRFIAQQEALGEVIDADARNWALDGCTSALAEVNTWAAERTGGQIMAFETAVPEVMFDGCSDCYSYIANPMSGATARVGEVIAFNGVTPPTSTDVFWDFGDGDSSESRTPSHAYQEPGTFLASFFVDYSNGSFAENQTLITVLSDDVVVPPQAALNVVLTWNSGLSDLDLHIIEPNGEEMAFFNVVTANGLTLSNDNTSGFGPEIGTLDNVTGVVESGQYRVDVVCFSATAPLPITGQVDITINAGLPNQSSARVPFTFSSCSNTGGESRIFIANMDLVNGIVTTAN